MTEGAGKTILVDTNVLVDVLTQDPTWYEWSAGQLVHCAARGGLAINPLIYAEISVYYQKIAELDAALPPHAYQRLPLPWEAAFLAGKAFLQYRQQGGARSSSLPDFYIGAHALASGLPLLTRDARRYRAYFPGLELIAPQD